MRPWLLCLPLLAACAPGLTAGDDPAAQAEITQSKKSKDTSVFALQGFSGDSSFFCSAVLIAPDRLLTGAHCVHPHWAGAGATFRVSNDSAVELGSEEGWRVTAAYPEAFDDEHVEAGNDIAVLKLATKLSIRPAKIAPWRLPAEWALPGDLESNPVSVRVVGYGASRDTTAQSALGTRMEATVPVTGLWEKQVIIGNGKAGQACHSDSGGPALLKYGAEEYVISVASFMQGQHCTTGNYGTRLDATWSFLVEQLGDLIVPELAPAPSDLPGIPTL